MSESVNVADVVKGRVCCGCGACVVACPRGAIEIAEGRHYNFARIDAAKCVECGLCRQVCPSTALLSNEPGRPAVSVTDSSEYSLAWAGDENVRRDGASGGFVTALLSHLLESGKIDGAVVVGADEDRPFHTRTLLAVTVREVLAARGSRYIPASACLGLAGVLDKPGRYAFVGKPCEVSALRMLQTALPVLGERIVLAVGLFCAQTPARSLTEAFLASVGVAKEDVEAVEYRGRGWPGVFTALGGGRTLYECDYGQVWDFLVDAVPSVRCFLCDDGMAERADISAGDPWGLPESFAVGDGMSYVVARTGAGKRFVAEAAAKGAIALDQAPDALVTGRNEMQARRAAVVTQRRLTYSAVFARSGIIKALRYNGFSFLPTLLRQRLRGEYF